jgi:hypothetical protein
MMHLFLHPTINLSIWYTMKQIIRCRKIDVFGAIKKNTRIINVIDRSTTHRMILTRTKTECTSACFRWWRNFSFLPAVFCEARCCYQLSHWHSEVLPNQHRGRLGLQDPRDGVSGAVPDGRMKHCREHPVIGARALAIWFRVNSCRSWCQLQMQIRLQWHRPTRIISTYRIWPLRRSLCRSKSASDAIQGELNEHLFARNRNRQE